jgi:hypothetical protein
MRRSARRLAIAGAFCAAVPLAAQTPSPEQPAEEPGIVVNGRAQTPSGNEVFDEARGISRVGRYDLYEKALPRFWKPVCPGVAGLRTDYAEAMVARMRDTIARLKAPLAKIDCSPNLVVAFEDDGRTLLADLKRDRPDIFRLVSQSEQAELLTGEAPVRVWNNIAPRWTGSGAPPRDWLHASVWGQLDRNAMPVSYDIVSALVIFNRGAAEGMTLTQLADYATMRGLSHTRPPTGEQPMSTILSLFDGDTGGPDALTDFDIGYLRSLYWWLPNASAAHRFADVSRWADAARKAGTGER